MNEFRSRFDGTPRATSLLRTKAPRSQAPTEGLGKIAVPRTETRRGNHRSADRHRLEAERATIRHNGRSQQVELINLSDGGAMVAGQLDAKLWDIVNLLLGEFGSIECAVRWNRGDRFGLEFAHETSVHSDEDTVDEMLRKVIRRSFPDIDGPLASRQEEADPAADELAQKRSATRHPMIWTGTIHHDYEWDAARLRNISAGGALIQCELKLPAGSTVYLDLGEAGKLAATVCWSCGDQAGLAFDEPFDVHLLARHKPQLAPGQWTKPDYLSDDSESSPWASRWGRLSLPELKKSLER